MLALMWIGESSSHWTIVRSPVPAPSAGVHGRIWDRQGFAESGVGPPVTALIGCSLRGSAFIFAAQRYELRIHFMLCHAVLPLQQSVELIPGSVDLCQPVVRQSSPLLLEPPLERREMAVNPI